MENIERIIIPLTIGGAVLGIWAALRGSGQAGATIVESSGAAAPSIPTVAPLEPTLIDPSGLAGSDAGASPSRRYTNAGYGRPQVQAPIGPNTTLNGTGLQGSPIYTSGYDDGLLPNSYGSQMPAWKNGQLAAIAAAAGWTPAPTKVPAADGGCGCGGGCSGAGSGKCPSSQNCSSLMDGSGSGFLPLYAQPMAAPAAWANGLIYSVETQITSPASVGVGHGDNVLSPAGY